MTISPTKRWKLGLGVIAAFAAFALQSALAQSRPQPIASPSREMFEILLDVQNDMARAQLDLIELKRDRDELREQVRRLQEQLDHTRTEFEGYRAGLCAARGIC